MPDADWVLVCPYCDLRDQLPDDELDRALELKDRVKRAAANLTQLDAMQRTLSHVFENNATFLRVTAPWLIAFVVITAQQVIGIWSATSHSGMKLSVPMLLFSALGTLWVGGIVLSFAVALGFGRWRYRTQVRAVLQSRPPRAPGKPARCRACGADLPPVKDAFTSCQFCSTHNLVTADVQADLQAQLQEEEDGYRSQGSKASRQVAKGVPNMTRIFIVGVVVSYGVMFAVAALASSMISR